MTAASAISADAIRWLPATERKVPLRCAACGHTGPHAPVAEVPALTPPHTHLTLLKCAGCDSLLYDPPGIREFSDFAEGYDGFWRFYVEAGGGIWETIWPVLACAERGNLLDVGCGFGFLLDFWQRTGRGDAIGVELAEYGRIGASELGVVIHQSLLEDCAALAGRRFDIVYASEVIEHVPDPRAFAATLAPFVADEGVLVLTTPAAAFVTPENRSSTLLAALAPGFHGFLLSERAFAEIVRSAGFPYVETHRFGERQLLFASRRPLTLELDHAKLREPFLAYMAERLTLPVDDKSVWLGYAYRYLRDLTNLGRHVEAKRVAARMRDVIAATYGLATLDPRQVVSKLSQCDSLAEAQHEAPLFVPCFFYYEGMLAQHVDRDIVRARDLYEGAVAAAYACARLGAVFFLEALWVLWEARIAGALLTLAENPAAAAATLSEIAQHGAVGVVDNPLAAVSHARIEGLLPDVAERLRARGALREASVVADAYERYVGRVYGDAMLTSIGIERAIGDPAARLPHDPLFPLWFAGLRARDTDGIERARPYLADVVRIAELFSDDARFASRFRERAAAARRLLGMPAQTRNALFEMAFTLKPPSG